LLQISYPLFDYSHTLPFNPTSIGLVYNFRERRDPVFQCGRLPRRLKKDFSRAETVFKLLSYQRAGRRFGSGGTVRAPALSGAPYVQIAQWRIWL